MQSKEIKNQLIKALIKNMGFDKDDFEHFEEIKVTVNNRIILITKQDWQEYFEATAG